MDGDEDAPLFPAGQEDEESEDKPQVTASEDQAKAGPSGAEEPDTLIDEDDLLRRAHENYETGAYSPKLMRFADVEEVCEKFRIEDVLGGLGPAILIIIERALLWRSEMYMQ